MTTLDLTPDGRVESVANRATDRLMRLAGSAWFLLLAIVFANALEDMVRAVQLGHGGLGAWATVLSRSCTLVFYLTLGWLMLVRRQPIARRRGLAPTIIAFLGTYAVWFSSFLPHATISPTLQVASAVVTLTGSVSLVFVVLYLGRSFSIVPQARKLVTDGPYKLVRHPLYVAEEIALIGVLMQYTWFAALPFLAVHIALQIRRMSFEESVLRGVFSNYDAYARRTARLIPGVW